MKTAAQLRKLARKNFVRSWDFEREIFFTRSVEIASGGINRAERTVELSFSSETPVKRTFPADHPVKALAGGTFLEVLDHSAGRFDFSLLNDGAPLLRDHDFAQQVGAVAKAYVEGGKGRAVVRFDTKALAEDEFQSVINGTRRNTSVGYTILNFRIENPEQPGGIPILRALHWKPFEVSTVALGADFAVGVGRSHTLLGSRSFLNRNQEQDPMEFTRSSFTRQDIEKYSLQRAILSAAENRGRPTGYEGEIADTLRQNYPKELATRGFLIPCAILHRDLSALSAQGGGATVETAVGGIIPILRKKSVLFRMGAQPLDGLRHNLSLPRGTATATASWLAEEDPIAESDQALNALDLSPHRIGATTRYSKQLLVQTGGGIERFIQGDLGKALAVAIDLSGIAGTGNNNQPCGILQTGGTATSITFGGAPTWADVVEFETNVANNDADIDSLGYVTTPNVRALWKTTPRISATGTGGFLWNPDDDTVNTYAAMASRQVPNDIVIFGNFSDVIVAGWGDAFDVIINPFSLATTGEAQITVSALADIGLLHPQSFCFSTDGGAQ